MYADDAWISAKGYAKTGGGFRKGKELKQESDEECGKEQ